MLSQIKLRTLLRKGEDQFITVSLTANILKVSEKKAQKTLSDLQHLGYIEQIVSIKGYWMLSIRGKLLANRRFKREYRVESLRNRLEALKDRIKEVNSSQKFPYRVDKAKIISQYPLVNKSNGIRIVYSLMRKELSDKEFKKRCDDLIQKSDKILNLVDEFFYPESAVKEFLRAKSHILKLVRVEADKIDLYEGHSIYTYLP